MPLVIGQVCVADWDTLDSVPLTPTPVQVSCSSESHHSLRHKVGETFTVNAKKRCFKEGPRIASWPGVTKSSPNFRPGLSLVLSALETILSRDF